MKLLALVLIGFLGLSNDALAYFNIYNTKITTVPGLAYNVVTDGGATCNGDVLTVTRTTSVTSGTKNLAVTVNTFSGGDVGKAIVIPGAGSSGGNYFGTIATVTNAQNVVLNNNASTTLSSVSTAITYGSDDAPAFKAFNTWAIANQGTSQVTLNVPNGSNCWFGSNQSTLAGIANNTFGANVKNLIVEGTGATLSSLNGWGFTFGGRGVCQVGLTQASGCSARIQSVSAGATQITLTSASLSAGYISRFTVGKWIMIGGLDVQGLWNVPTGFPPNNTNFEWRQIITVNAGTGVITLNGPISNSYLSTWPNYNTGNNFEADQGGQATIWTVDDSWNAIHEYRGLTLSTAPTVQINGNLRNLTLRNVAFTGAASAGGLTPSQNESWTAISTNFGSRVVEVDKLVGTITLDTVTGYLFQFQSNSIDRVVVRNSSFSVGFQGSGKTTEITDSTFAELRPGTYNYGNTMGPFTCTRCVVTVWEYPGGVSANLASTYSMSGGVISFPNTAASSGAQIWASTIGIPIFFATAGWQSLGIFSVLGLTQDATNVYVQTNLAGGFPDTTNFGGSYIRFNSNGAPQFTCDDCTGDATLTAASVQAGASPLAPMMTYSSRSFAPTANFKNTSPLVVRGNLVSLKVNVTQPYTGTGAAILNPTGEFHNFTVKQSDATQFDWWPTINLKVAGERIITPGGVTCDGVAGPCSGDTINSTNGYPSEAIWLAINLDPSQPSTISGGGVKPLYTITAQTEQEIIPPTPPTFLRQENFFGLTGAAWQDPSTYYVPGTGNPSVSTSDYYDQSGVYWMRPYDLTATACGATGASIAAANGRYVWTASADHPSQNTVFSGTGGISIGFSNDPGVPPSTLRRFYYGSTITTPAPVATITADISNGSGGAGNILNVTAVASGQITFDNHANVTGSGVTTVNITGQSTGARAQVGTYTLSGSAQLVTSRTMTVNQVNFHIYQAPFFVCNPDDAIYPFYVYAEGSASSLEHEEGVIKSADLVTWTSPAVTGVVWTFGSFGAWSSFQRPVRDSVGVWHSTGLNVRYTSANVFGLGKWTSTDGLVWLPNLTTLFNTCLPPNTTGPVGKLNCPDSPASAVQLSASPDRITIGAQDWTAGHTDYYPTAGGARSGTQSVVRVPIDANFNVLATPTAVTIGTYGGSYPGPTFLNAGNSYVEDGVIHYYANVGFPISTSSNGLVNGATYANGGGLWQQGLDYYTEVIDATAAADAAPNGVRASCASSTVTIQWYDTLPNRTYRVYRGTTAGTQATLVGSVTGLSITNSPTPGSVYYYKVVTLNAGVEKQSRVVSTYCSASSALVNAHMTRALAAGATNIDTAWLDTFYNWLNSNSLTNDLLFATMVDFGVIKSGSNISTIMDFGTTRLPKGGDYTPTTPASTTYNATGINGFPSWVNGTTTAQGYYGGGRINNIQRKTQITAFAAYQKPNTGAISPFVMGQFNSRMMLQHTSGSPGGVSFLLADATHLVTATATMSGAATDFHTIAGTYDGTTLLAYADAVAGTGQPGLVIPSPNLLPPDMLTGSVAAGDATTSSALLSSGGDGGLGNASTGGRTITGSLAQYSGAAQIIFDKALTGAQITSLNTLIRTHYGL